MCGMGERGVGGVDWRRVSWGCEVKVKGKARRRSKL